MTCVLYLPSTDRASKQARLMQLEHVQSACIRSLSLVLARATGWRIIIILHQRSMNKVRQKNNGLTTEYRATFEGLSLLSGSSARQSIPKYII